MPPGVLAFLTATTVHSQDTADVAQVAPKKVRSDQRSRADAVVPVKSVHKNVDRVSANPEAEGDAVLVVSL